jgi:hypothetical protein
MHGGVPNPVRLLHVLPPEERLHAIQPWERVFLAVERQEFEADTRVESIAVGVVVVGAACLLGSLWRRHVGLVWRWRREPCLQRVVVDGVLPGVDLPEATPLPSR